MAINYGNLRSENLTDNNGSVICTQNKKFYATGRTMQIDSCLDCTPFVLLPRSELSLQFEFSRLISIFFFHFVSSSSSPHLHPFSFKNQIEPKSWRQNSKIQRLWQPRPSSSNVLKTSGASASTGSRTCSKTIFRLLQPGRLSCITEVGIFLKMLMPFWFNKKQVHRRQVMTIASFAGRSKGYDCKSKCFMLDLAGMM